MKLKFPWYSFSIGGWIGLISVVSYVSVFELITIKQDINDIKQNVVQVESRAIFTDDVYGKLASIKSVYRNRKIDYFVLNVEQHKLHPSDKNVIQYRYPNDKLTDTQLLKLIENNYCLRLVIDSDNNSKTQYQSIKDINLVQKYCE